MLFVGEAMRFAVAGAELLRERLQSGVSYNPLSSRTAQDPYPVYAALRTGDPAHRSRLLKSWLFTRHSDVDAILRDHRHFASDPRKGTLSSRQHTMLPPPDEFTLLFLDPPDHTRLRALVNKAFTPKAVNDDARVSVHRLHIRWRRPVRFRRDRVPRLQRLFCSGLSFPIGAQRPLRDDPHDET